MPISASTINSIFSYCVGSLVTAMAGLQAVPHPVLLELAVVLRVLHVEQHESSRCLENSGLILPTSSQRMVLDAPRRRRGWSRASKKLMSSRSLKGVGRREDDIDQIVRERFHKRPCYCPDVDGQLDFRIGPPECWTKAAGSGLARTDPNKPTRRMPRHAR